MIDLVCAVCRNSLNITYQQSAIAVEPCQMCANNYYDDGFEDGLQEGKKVAENE